jgi:hypothetical protein
MSIDLFSQKPELRDYAYGKESTEKPEGLNPPIHCSLTRGIASPKPTPREDTPKKDVDFTSAF